MANRFTQFFGGALRFLEKTVPDNVTTVNDKYDVFDQVDHNRTERTNNLAVTLNNTNYGRNPQASIARDVSYYQFVYSQLDYNKKARIEEYRLMAKSPKIADCIDEYAQACINRQKDETLISLEIKGIPDKQIEEIEKEWVRFIRIFKLKEKGREIITDLMTEGEVYWENVISKEKPELGILDVKRIPAENIDPFYSNIQNDDIDHFLLKKKTQKLGEMMYSADVDATQFTPMHRYQVTYANSGKWDKDRKNREPFIENARQSQKRLSLIEDSIVINALVNAPDRLLFNIPTGNMPDAQSKQYMQQFINDFYRKRGYDENGNVVDQYNPMSVTEAIFIQKPRGQDAATLERLAGSQAFGNNFSEMLQYFHNAVYADMHVPVSRLNAESQASDGTVATFQEIAFGERVKELQIQISEAIRRTFITHLKLRGITLHKEAIHKMVFEKSELDSTLVGSALLLETHMNMIDDGSYSKISKTVDPGVKDKYTSLWDNYRLDDEMIDVDFSLPSITLALREQQYFELKVNQFNQLASNENFSVYYLSKKYLEWSDEEIKVNREWKRIEAEEFWETANIMENGPDFRKQIADEMAGDLSASGGGSSLGGGDGGGGGDPFDELGGGTGGPPETGKPGGSQEESPLPDFGDSGSETGGDEGGGDTETTSSTTPEPGKKDAKTDTKGLDDL